MSPHTQSFAVLSNAALVDRCRHQDEAAFTEIFKRHRQMVYHVCLRYLGHHHDAEDVTQETFRRAALAMPRVDSRRPLEPWLVTIAANRCRTFLSRRKNDRSVDHLDDGMADTKVQSDIAKCVSLDEQINHALGRLPDNQRRAFELVHRKEMSYPEAASVMGRSTGTIKTWVRRAKMSMQSVLAGESTATPSSDRASTVKTTATWVASVFVLACLWSGYRGPFSEESTASNRSVSPALVPETGNSRSSVASTDIPASKPNSPSVAPNPSLAATGSPTLAPEYEFDAIDWQFVSLDSFSNVRFAADDINALPVAQWVDETTPTINHLRSGIEPLGKTLQRVAYLFRCDLAVSETTPAAMTSPAPAHRIDGVDSSGNGLSDTFPEDGPAGQPTLGSVS
ncbi:RNA polymerase sigma factor [Rhodopirellula sp. SWK7]|uniref:RNA polymerase sigma factor n=1 Tax=Rhodopirellula sp. SWK7 TaxID=595460 RepID=UPI0002BECB06|nr:RNA polymerase sigma factor [Rhodopirellula sp. SWK7]EMI44813.1 RNA polymerase sigma-70 [Rhodopirellula sp. SWK7]